MSSHHRRQSTSWTRGIRGLISFFALFLAIGILFFQLTSSVFLAFSLSSWTGFRSIAAAIFPLSISVYFAFLARPQVPKRESRAPIINNFVIFLFWSMLLFGIDGNNDGSQDLVQFPLEELLYSATLSVMILRHRYRDSFKHLLACCYGVLSGSLAAVILFGINPVRL